MRTSIRTLISLVVLSVGALAQVQFFTSANVPSSTPPPPSAFIQSAAGTTGASSAASFTVTFASNTAAGDGIVCVRNDSGSPAAPSVPTMTGATFTQAQTYASVQSNRVSVYTAPVTSGGNKVITFPAAASGKAAGGCMEFSNMAASSLVDAIPSLLHANSSATALFSDISSSTQTDVAVGFCITGATATTHYAAAGNWSNLLDIPQSSDGDDVGMFAIANGTLGQFVLNATGDSHNYSCGEVLVKALGTGSFSGNQVTAYMNMTGTNGNAVTLANFPITPSVGTLTFANGTSCFTYSNANGLTTPTSISANGQTFTPTGTNSVGYALSCNGASDNQIVINPIIPNVTTTVSSGYLLKYPNTAALDNFTPGGFVSATSTDRCYPLISSASGATYLVSAETAGGDSVGTIDVTSYVTGGNPFWITTQMVTTGSGNCSVAVYDPVTKAQVGSTITHSVASGTPITWSFGRFDTGVATGTAYFGKVVLDVNGGTFPILP